MQPTPDMIHEFAAQIASGLISNDRYLHGIFANDFRNEKEERRKQFAKICYDLAEALMEEGDERG